MAVPSLVDVANRADNLLKYYLALSFGQPLVRELFDVMVETGSMAEFHDQMYMCPLIHNFK